MLPARLPSHPTPALAHPLPKQDPDCEAELVLATLVESHAAHAAVQPPPTTVRRQPNGGPARLPAGSGAEWEGEEEGGGGQQQQQDQHYHQEQEAQYQGGQYRHEGMEEEPQQQQPQQDEEDEEEARAMLLLPQREPLPLAAHRRQFLRGDAAGSELGSLDMPYAAQGWVICPCWLAGWQSRCGCLLQHSEAHLLCGLPCSLACWLGALL